ncbi:MAG: TonB-dependent receptor [Prevotellaceae bacterium]|nr:TonB-dependent receptor [Prevotellaceae bacterium]
MKKLIYLLLCFSIFSVAMAAPISDKKKDANLMGHVLEKGTNEPLNHVTLQLKGTTIGTISDLVGHYILRDLPQGKFTLVASSVGFATQEIPVELVAGKTLEIDIYMEEDAVALDAVVVSANRNETKRKMASTLVNVVDVKLFERTQSTDLSQGLKFQPGVRVENNCQNCGFTQVRINGLDGPYSQILIDSRPVFSALAGVYGLEQIPANMIERVEVMRGGGSALFGSSAIAGTINIITKEPLSNGASLSHQLRALSGSSFENTTNLNASLLTENRKLGATLFGQVRHRSAFDKDGDGYSEIPLLDGRTLGIRSFLKTGQYSKLTAEYHNIHEFRRGGDLINNEPHNAHIAEQIEHNNHVGSLSFVYNSPDERHHFNAYASFMKVHRKSYYGGGETLVSELLTGKPLNEEQGKYIRQRMASYGRTTDLTYMMGTQYSYDAPYLLFMPAQFTAGIEYMNDRLEDQSGYRRTPILQKVNTKSFYFQNEWKNAHWGILLGGRIDKHSMLKRAIFSPRANLRFNPTADWNFRFSYSQGFRAPQLFDESLHVDNAAEGLIVSELDPKLKEEKSHSWSLSTDWYRRFGAFQLNVMVEGFYTTLKDAFGDDPARERTSEGVTYKVRTNLDGAKVFGTNIEAKLAWRNSYQIQAGVTLQRSLWNNAHQWNDEDSYSTRRMYRTPNAYAYWVASAQLNKRLNLSISGNYTGSMLVGHEIPTEEDGTLSSFGNGTAATVHAERLLHGKGQTATTYGARTFRTPTFMEIGIKATYDLPLYQYYTLQLYAGVQNLFNAYQRDFDRGPQRDSAYIYGPMSPRSYTIGCKLSF